MATKWQLYDIIDLEFLLTTPHDDESDRHKRDRQWYIDKLDSQFAGTTHSDQEILAAFLTEKRSSTDELPGRLFQEFSRLITVITLLVALLTGSALTAAALWYDGSVPVNVFRFLGLLLLPQLIFLFFILLSLLVKRENFIERHPSVLLNLGRDVLLKLFFKLKKLTLASHGMDRERSKTITEVIKKHSKLFFYPVFNFFQLFAIGFNIAALATLLIRIAVSDIAFGWQSTLNISSTFLFRLTQIIAIPWKHLFPNTLPTLDQIEGSRIILKEGISVLTNEALTSWWPFLFFTLLCYGLLPRMFILLYGATSERKCLRAFLFDQPEIKRLLQRMQTPYVSSAGEQPAAAQQGIAPSKETVSLSKPVNADAHILLPEDIQYDPETLKILISSFGFSAASTQRVEMYWENDEPILPAAAAGSNILVLVEAWMPPIVDTLRFLEQLVNHYGDALTIYIGLIGKPIKGLPFTPPSNQEIGIWQTKIESIQNKNLQIIPCTTTEDKP